ncbi:MAG: hypothetical protein R3B95_15940 [Nitrospirales bacterium]|nr:hypothetical protein [Nitrospirales bacterium]
MANRFFPGMAQENFWKTHSHGKVLFQNHGVSVMTDVDCQFDHALLARILIPWVGSLSGWIEDVGLTRMVINGNW